MRSLLSVIAIIFFSAIAEYFLPWWSMAAVCFLVAVLTRNSPGRSFLTGSAGAGLLWLVVACMKDMSNEHILSSRMASLFHLPGCNMFIMVTVLVGALVGGLASLSGAYMNAATKK